MPLNLIDIHAHLQFSDYDDDREEVIARTRAAAVGVINVGTDLETSRQATVLAKANDAMWAVVGIHPSMADQELSINWKELEVLAEAPEVVAIGECGLDIREGKFEAGGVIGRRQIELFERQIELALRVGKPLMIHCRNAYEVLIGILRGYSLRPLINVHFFAGDWTIAEKFLDLGSTLSFTGVITFPSKMGQPESAVEAVIKRLPLDRLMVETDCPFVAPVPWRGKRNEPLYVAEVVKRVAALKNLESEMVRLATLATAKNFFSLAF